VRQTFDAGFEFPLSIIHSPWVDKLTAGENISIVDLRQPMDLEAFPQMIPGALRIAMEEIEDRHGEIPRDRDVVLYCS
jgi:rhodanese-related sulfurtransferase